MLVRNFQGSGSLAVPEKATTSLQRNSLRKKQKNHLKATCMGEMETISASHPPRWTCGPLAHAKGNGSHRCQGKQRLAGGRCQRRSFNSLLEVSLPADHHPDHLSKLQGLWRTLPRIKPGKESTAF